MLIERPWLRPFPLLPLEAPDGACHARMGIAGSIRFLELERPGHPPGPVLCNLLLTQSRQVTSIQHLQDGGQWFQIAADRGSEVFD